MFCPTCGSTNPDDGTSCKMCGGDLQAASAGLSRPRPAPAPSVSKRPLASTMLGVAMPGQGNITPPAASPAAPPQPSMPASVPAHSARPLSVPQKRNPQMMGTMLGVAAPAVGSAPMPTMPYAARSRDRVRATPRAELGELVRARGAHVVHAPAEVEALLYKHFQHDVALLIAAQNAGVPQTLQMAAPSGQLAACIAQLVASLVQTHQLSQDDALYAVESWALALNLAVG